MSDAELLATLERRCASQRQHINHLTLRVRDLSAQLEVAVQFPGDSPPEKARTVASRALVGFVKDYLMGYEYEHQDAAGIDAIHAPNDLEAAMIEDAITNLVNDPDFITLAGTDYLTRQTLRAARGECVRCGGPPGQHLGGCGFIPPEDPL